MFRLSKLRVIDEINGAVAFVTKVPLVISDWVIVFTADEYVKEEASIANVNGPSLSEASTINLEVQLV